MNAHENISTANIIMDTNIRLIIMQLIKSVNVYLIKELPTIIKKTHKQLLNNPQKQFLVSLNFPLIIA